MIPSDLDPSACGVIRASWFRAWKNAQLMSLEKGATPGDDSFAANLPGSCAHDRITR